MITSSQQRLLQPPDGSSWRTSPGGTKSGRTGLGFQPSGNPDTLQSA